MEPRQLKGKEYFFQQRIRKIEHPHTKHVNLDSHFTSFRKINSIMNHRVTYETKKTMKLLEGKI